MVFIKILRPWQWAKNILIFFPFLLSGMYTSQGFIDCLVVFLLFSFLASGNYIFNDIHDSSNDAQHPIKSQRPIPSGAIGISSAKFLGYFLILFSLVLSFLNNYEITILFLLYLLVANIYTTRLKYIFPYDSLCVSTFFLIRLFIGGKVANVDISIYLLLYIFFTSLFISTLKKISIINTADIKSSKYSKILDNQNEEFPLIHLSYICIVLSNISLIIWSTSSDLYVDGYRYFILIIFIGIYFVFTLELHLSAKNAELEDFVLGVVNNKKVMSILMIQTLNFIVLYF